MRGRHIDSVSMPTQPKTSSIVAICSDIHFPLHSKECWAAFRAWHRDTRPDKTVILGDFLDFGMLSRYVQEANAPVHAIPQIELFVREANALALESREVIVMEGNHDERWGKILGVNPQFLKGAKGLTLHDQCLAHGLSQNITWMREDMLVKGVPCGPFMLRHGHKQAGKFGGAKHIAANRLAKTMGQSEVVGHHHRAQMFCQSAYGRTAVSIANPSLTGPHEYAPDADWQNGFTVLELYGPNQRYCTPHLVLMSEGTFAWGGKVYDGQHIVRERNRKR